MQLYWFDGEKHRTNSYNKVLIGIFHNTNELQNKKTEDADRNGIEERILINRLREGDKTAFELLFKHYYPGLVIYASNYIQDREEAEEIVQNFFVRLWVKRHQIFICEQLHHEDLRGSLNIKPSFIQSFM